MLRLIIKLLSFSVLLSLTKGPVGSLYAIIYVIKRMFNDILSLSGVLSIEVAAMLSICSCYIKPWDNFASNLVNPKICIIRRRTISNYSIMVHYAICRVKNHRNLRIVTLDVTKLTFWGIQILVFIQFQRKI